MLNVYRSGKVETDDILDYLKGILPSKTYTQKQIIPGVEPLDSTIMVSREQERVNFLLVSFIRETIRDELEKFPTIEKVEFKEDSMIGTLFYRVLKSQ